MYTDAGNCGLLNMGDFLISHDVLREYLRLFVGERFVELEIS